MCVCVIVCVLAEFQKIYDRLGVTIIERGESFYQPMMPVVVKDLEEKGEPLVVSMQIISADRRMAKTKKVVLLTHFLNVDLCAVL